MEMYYREQVPMGSEKGIGYLVWGISRAATCLQAGEPNKAHVVLLLLIAADSSWTTAWCLAHQTPPPSADWKARELSLGQLRADHAHSRLVHLTWAASVMARLKNEEVLTKRISGTQVSHISAAGCYAAAQA